MYSVGKSGPQDLDARHISFTVFSRQGKRQQEKSYQEN
jgi:hypothetical protein